MTDKRVVSPKFHVAKLWLKVYGVSSLIPQTLSVAWLGLANPSHSPECQNEILAEPEARIAHSSDSHCQIRSVKNIADGIANPVRLGMKFQHPEKLWEKSCGRNCKSRPT